MKHLVSMVLTRIEDKHRNQTEIFRFLDQRGKNKVNKNDFKTAIERLRISLAREDINKVWAYIDARRRGYIQLEDIAVAYTNRVTNFGKTIENVVENRAFEGYNQQQNAEAELKASGATSSVQQSGISKALKASRDQFKGNSGTRSPMHIKSLDYTFGAKNLRSDDVGAVVGNVYALEAEMLAKARAETFA